MKKIGFYILLFYFANHAYAKKLFHTPNLGDRWHLEQIAGSKNVHKLAQKIYFDNEWTVNDNNIFDLLDSLNSTSNTLAKPFYFKVITKTYSKANGDYAESLGNFGSEYIKNNTTEFLNFFIGEESFTNEEFIIWSNIVMLNFKEDNAEKLHSDVADFSNYLTSNCTECNEDEVQLLQDFIALLELSLIEK